MKAMWAYLIRLRDGRVVFVNGTDKADALENARFIHGAENVEGFYEE